MPHKLNIVSMTLLFASLTQMAYSQEINEEITENKVEIEEEFKRNKFALYTGYSWIPEGRDPETLEKKSLIAPTFGFSYEYWFSERWAIGTYNDVEIINLQVEEEEEAFLERENAVVLTVGVTYELLPKLTVSLGGGIETDSNETLGVIRLGSEYVLLEKNEWELSAALTFIHKDIYEIVGFGFVFGKKF